MQNINEILRILKKETEKYNEILVSDYVWKKYRDPLKVLIAIVLSIRSKEENTLKSCENLFSKIKTPEDLLNIPEDQVISLIKPCGLPKQKARWIKEIAKYYIDNHYKLPKNTNELIKLPGVGRKVANVYLSVVYGENVIAVDTHVHRIFNRLGIVSTKTPEETEKELYKIIPKRWWKNINKIFVKFGRNVCLPRNPKCEICPIKNKCKYYLLKNK